MAVAIVCSILNGSIMQMCNEDVYGPKCKNLINGSRHFKLYVNYAIVSTFKAIGILFQIANQRKNT